MKTKRVVVVSCILLPIVIIIYFVNHFCNCPSALELKETCYVRVPDAKTAIKIAEVIGSNTFGRRINRFKPFKAILVNDSIWHVYGTTPKNKLCIQVGGTPVFEIQKTNCTILNIYIAR